MTASLRQHFLVDRRRGILSPMREDRRLRKAWLKLIGFLDALSVLEVILLVLVLVTAMVVGSAITGYRWGAGPSETSAAGAAAPTIGPLPAATEANDEHQKQEPRAAE